MKTFYTMLGAALVAAAPTAGLASLTTEISRSKESCVQESLRQLRFSITTEEDLADFEKVLEADMRRYQRTGPSVELFKELTYSLPEVSPDSPEKDNSNVHLTYTYLSYYAFDLNGWYAVTVFLEPAKSAGDTSGKKSLMRRLRESSSLTLRQLASRVVRAVCQ